MSPPPALGLALGGGGALGFAHVGVLAALHDRGLRPDAYAGTSAGAVVAALAAFGVGPEAIRERLGALRWRSVSDPARSRLGFLDNAELGELLVGALGPVRVEEANVPLAVVAVDVHTGERVVIREGPLALAVRASAAVPGVFVPVPVGARLLIDGAVIENVPARPLRALGARVVVGVNVIGAPPHRPVRTAAQVLTNAAYIALQAGARRPPPDGADVLVEPDLSGRSVWDARDLPALWDAGWRAGEGAAPKVAAAVSATPFGDPPVRKTDLRREA